MIKQSTVQRGVGSFAVSCDEGYPVNSLSKKFKENEGKSILLTCIITYIFHHHLLLWSPKEEDE